MLILSRRVGERIRIDDDVVVTVLEIKGRAVRLGIDAPREVRVDRHEAAERRRAGSDARDVDTGARDGSLDPGATAVAAIETTGR